MTPKKNRVLPSVKQNNPMPERELPVISYQTPKSIRSTHSNVLENRYINDSNKVNYKFIYVSKNDKLIKKRLYKTFNN